MKRVGVGETWNVFSNYSPPISPALTCDPLGLELRLSWKFQNVGHPLNG